MNIVKFTRHVASRKRVPVLMETKTLQVEMPPPCADTTPNMTPNKCKGNATLPVGTVEGVGLAGKRQWIRLRVSSPWIDQQLDALGVKRSDTPDESASTPGAHSMHEWPTLVDMAGQLTHTSWLA